MAKRGWLGEMDAVRWIGTVLILGLAGTCGVGMCAKECSPSAKKKTGGASTSRKAPKQKAAPKEDPIETLLAIQSMPEALAACLPSMGDSVDSPSVGGALFAIWAARKMNLLFVRVPRNETSFAAVKKDSVGERGKRICFNGKIVEIAKSDNGQGDTIYEGKMFDSDFNIATFYAAGSTEGVFEGTKTRFCGVVSGRHSYSNAGGGTSHSVEMIGVFDIPANR